MITGPVQQATGSKTSGATVVVTPATTPVVGNYLVVTSAYNGAAGAITGITGGGVTTWAVARAGDYNNWDASVWYGKVDTGGGGNVTVTYVTAAANAAVNLSEWRGLKDSGALGSVGVDFGTNANPATASLTPASAPALVIGMHTRNGNDSPRRGPESGFTDLTEVAAQSLRNSTAYLIQTVAAAVKPTWVVASQTWDGTGIVLLGAVEPPGAFIAGGFF